MENVKNIFVSVTGNDLGDGTIENPLKTLKAAQVKCRELLKENVSVNIYLREGDYFESLAFTEEDSAKDGNSVTFSAYENENVRILGGMKFDNITKISDKDVLSRLDEKTRDKAYEISLTDEEMELVDDYSPYMTFREPDAYEIRLVKNGEIMYPASYPNLGEYLRIEEVISQDNYTNGDRETDFFKTKPARVKISYDKIKNWKEPSKVWIYGYPSFDWACYFGKAHDIDAESGCFSLYQPLPFAVRENQRIRFVNILEELDTPEEFYIDRDAKKIYVICENPEEDVYEIALAKESLLTINNANGINIKNITFSLCRTTSVKVEDSQNINIIGCNFFSNMKDAIKLKNCYDCEMYGNHIKNMGGGGFDVECGDCGNLKESGVRIVNNEIHDFAKIIEMYQCAVYIKGYGNYVAHNEIYDTIQTVIRFFGNCNIFEYNDIHDCLKQTADSGAVNNGRNWISSGNIFRYNYFHDLPISTRESHTTKGIYLDDILLGTEIYSNIFENVQSGVYSHGGRKATVKNNIFIDCKKFSVRFFPCYHAPCPGFMENYLIKPTKKWISEHPEWAKKFPEAEETANDPLCMFPMYNRALGNIIFNSPDISVEYGAVHTTELKDNLVTDDETIFEDYKNRNFAIRDIEKLRKLIPDFDAPDFDKIGLLNKAQH